MKKLFLIYSNHSEKCKQILHTANLLENDINKLCIDNRKIRNIVTRDKKFNITLVPTILLQDNNSYEKYEGQVATNFLKKILENKKKISTKQKNEELKNYNLLKSKNKQLLEQSQIINTLQAQIKSIEVNKQSEGINNFDSSTKKSTSKRTNQDNNVEIPKRTNIIDLKEEEEEEDEKLQQKPTDINSKVEQFKKEREQNLK